MELVPRRETAGENSEVGPPGMRLWFGLALADTQGGPEAFTLDPVACLLRWRNSLSGWHNPGVWERNLLGQACREFGGIMPLEVTRDHTSSNQEGPPCPRVLRPSL